MYHMKWHYLARPIVRMHVTLQAARSWPPPVDGKRRRSPCLPAPWQRPRRMLTAPCGRLGVLFPTRSRHLTRMTAGTLR
eukprot:6178365-Pleurochrysis_carterae.AAC.1